MFSLLLVHELRDILQGPRFTVVFSISTVLLLTSTIIGLDEYQRRTDHYEARIHAQDEEIRAADQWYSVSVSAYKAPDPLSVFAAGVSMDVGEQTSVGGWGGFSPIRSPYSTDTLFAFFRFLDFSFVFQMVVSLLAILFTYDRISGDRASGTLRMVMSNAVPRVRLILAKLGGAWIGLTVPLLLVIGICLLVAVLTGFPLDASTAPRLFAIVFMCILYLSCFVSLGLLVSSLTHSPSTSFLVLLVLWVAFALIIPRVATEVAGQVVRPATVAELQMEQARFALNLIDGINEKYENLGKQQTAATKGMTQEERETYYERTRDEWNEKYMAIQEEFSRTINEHHDRLQEARRADIQRRRRLALGLSRMSPAGAFHLALMRVAGTGLESKESFEDAVKEYDLSFEAFRRQKQREGGFGPNDEPLDPAEMPHFTQPAVHPSDAITAAMPDILLLVFYTVVALAGTFVAFLRYDVR